MGPHGHEQEGKSATYSEMQRDPLQPSEVKNLGRDVAIGAMETGCGNPGRRTSKRQALQRTDQERKYEDFHAKPHF